MLLSPRMGQSAKKRKTSQVFIATDLAQSLHLLLQRQALFF